MRLRDIYRNVCESGLNLLYPHRCPICHRVLADQRALICPACFAGLHPIGEPRCRLCGSPVEENRELCGDCAASDRSFDEGRGIYLYTERMRYSLIRFKYGGRREYARFFGRAMYVYGYPELLRWKPDLIVPIPLHRRNRQQRGFNQAEILAEKIGALCGIPVSAEILKKKNLTRSQKTLNARERRKNLRQAFSVEAKLCGERILLIDDVFTTGSTIDAAASCLREAGASAVFFLTLCIAGGE